MPNKSIGIPLMHFRNILSEEESGFVVLFFFILPPTEPKQQPERAAAADVLAYLPLASE